MYKLLACPEGQIISLSRAPVFINLLRMPNYKPAFDAHVYRVGTGADVQQLPSANSLLAKQTKP